MTGLTQQEIALLTRSIVRPAKYEFENIMAKLKRHANEADKTAVAIELLKAGESRKGKLSPSGKNLWLCIYDTYKSLP